MTSKVRFNSCWRVQATVLLSSLFLWVDSGTAQPVNDNFVNATIITASFPSMVTGSNVNATREANDPTTVAYPSVVFSPNRRSTTGGKSVWWRWTAPATQNVTIATRQSAGNFANDSSFDTQLGVYTGIHASLNEIASAEDAFDGSNENFLGGGRSSVTFQAVQGTTYHIMVDGWPGEGGLNDGTTGTIRLYLTAGSTPPLPPLQIATEFLPGGNTAASYSHQVSATGGQLPYSWSLTPGSAPLPPGLSLSASGMISGIPTSEGTFGFFVRVTDASLNTGDSDYLSITITIPPLVVPTMTLPSGMVEASYTAQLSATGGQPPYSWALAPGSLLLPAGLSLANNGLISGIATTSGTNDFIVRATDANLSIANRSMRIIVHPKLTLGLLTRISSSQFQMRLTGVSNQNYTIQYSTTLTNWISFFTNNSPGDSFDILDSDATNGARFYRALVVP